MKKVRSSSIKGFEWENNKLIVHFVSGAIYEYLGVPESIWKNILESQISSYGKWLRAVIIPAYKSNRIK